MAAVFVCTCLLMLAPASIEAAEHEAPMPEATSSSTDDQLSTTAPVNLEQSLEITTETKQGNFGAEDLSALLAESPECLAPEYEISYAGERSTCPFCQFGTCDPNDPGACGGSGCGVCVQFPTVARCLCLYV